MPIPKATFDPRAVGPLHGVRVLDFSRLVAGNMLSLQLADLGAEVVKVEAPAIVLDLVAHVRSSSAAARTRSST
jgi:crotonobetainyl-CoA:carnitine CoA-transferase CaiB-like acyl-CoA transferase